VTAVPMGRRSVHPIEVESYAILRSRLDLSHLPPLSRAVAERVVHSSADLAYADDLVLEEEALEQGWQALADGAPIVADSRMVAAGITARDARVPLADPRVPERAAAWSATRSAAAIRLAVAEVGPGAVWIVGNAPTALFELLDHPDLDPALVIGLPVGFVGATESKQALRERGWPAITNVSEKGGSAVAASACNALLYHHEENP
jgi:precorrin-8X/cobalt-precorrin-8 methylmutase